MPNSVQELHMRLARIQYAETALRGRGKAIGAAEH